MNRIVIQARAVQASIGLGLLAASVVCAQPVETFSNHLLNRLAFPTPTAYHVRTQQLIVGTTAGEVRGIPAFENGKRGDAETLHRARGNSILRVRIDAQRDRLWVLDIGHVHVFDLSKKRLLRTIALPNWFYAGHGTNCLPDLQVDTHGSAFVSDNIQPKLWRIDGRSFSVYERSVSLDSQRALDVGFSALAISEGGVMFAAMAAPGSLWRIDTDLSRAEMIPLTAPIHGACGLEMLSAVGSREFTLFALVAQRASFDVRRIDMAAGGRTAHVDTIALGSFAAPANLVAASGALYVASNNGAFAVSERARADNARFALRPVYRLQ